MLDMLAARYIPRPSLEQREAYNSLPKSFHLSGRLLSRTNSGFSRDAISALVNLSDSPGPK